MKVSNQLCSTILKHVFLRFHHCFPLPSSTLTWQHLNLRTQPYNSICIEKKKDFVELHNCWLCILSNTTLHFQKLCYLVKGQRIFIKMIFFSFKAIKFNTETIEIYNSKNGWEKVSYLSRINCSIQYIQKDKNPCNLKLNYKVRNKKYIN